MRLSPWPHRHPDQMCENEGCDRKAAHSEWSHTGTWHLCTPCRNAYLLGTKTDQVYDRGNAAQDRGEDPYGVTG